VRLADLYVKLNLYLVCGLNCCSQFAERSENQTFVTPEEESQPVLLKSPTGICFDKVGNLLIADKVKYSSIFRRLLSVLLDKRFLYFLTQQSDFANLVFPLS
jgi:hypothetical protein